MSLEAEYEETWWTWADPDEVSVAQRILDGTFTCGLPRGSALTIIPPLLRACRLIEVRMRNEF